VRGTAFTGGGGGWGEIIHSSGDYQAVPFIPVGKDGTGGKVELWDVNWLTMSSWTFGLYFGEFCSLSPA
jgi:hypothetical protein